MSTHPLTEAHWLATMAAWRRWFNYSVEGLEHLRTHECKIVVGYHGRPLAWDLFMLGAEIHREQGYLPLALVHYDFMKWPYLRWLTEGLEWSTGKGPILDAAIAEGRHVILAPGGEREGLRPGWVRYEVDWRGLGYLRLAISRGLEVVPVAASGVDEAYFGLFDNAAARDGLNALRRRLGLSGDSKATLWTGVGPLGTYPFSPPFRARVHQIVGAPVIPVYPEDERRRLLGDRDALLALHERVQQRVQALLDEACAHALSPGNDPRALQPGPIQRARVAIPRLLRALDRAKQFE
ncbi:acyltransferase [Pseudenhygromyxa sp. WMMC2535]|uniref:acyltransferase n=1 Tax=Pseudenhygromyxa sp. WMMC2535 TaxID=2712867 RepID=UPI001551BD6D|nr:acyltransferase [Pseudenhygromyxa sp. WMMC2535]NVB42424.1 acyltransferase [Pseudenhygromyxa sp. WMMC2535]